MVLHGVLIGILIGLAAAFWPGFGIDIGLGGIPAMFFIFCIVIYGALVYVGRE